MPGKESVTLPGWFIWVFTVLGVPCVLGAVPWAYMVQMNLTEINVNLKHIQDEEITLAAKIAMIEDRIDAHIADPEIHKYALNDIRGELQRLTDRVERIETDLEGQ